MAKATKKNNDTGANLGFEAKLWQMADGLRNNMDAAEYKHVVLGLIFLKYISDAFEAKHAELDAQKAKGADPEDPDEYRAVSIFWVPPEARWKYLKSMAPQPTIGQLVDDAMSAIERDNPSLKGVLPKDFARPGLDKQRLGQIINLVSDIAFSSPRPQAGEGTSSPPLPQGEGRGEGGVDRAKDTLGRVYEYFLARFASAEGKSGGQFYTPSRVVRVLVEMLAPYKGRVYDPCCGSGGMFVSSEKFIEAHSGKLGDISIYGQESNYTTWRLAKMNLAIRGIDAQIGHGDAFHNDAHPDLKADYVLANPPFNDSDWRGELLKNDKRWAYGVPPAGNANYAWVQHFIYHLAPTGLAGFVLANGSMSSNQSGEGEIRKAIIEADLVDCMVALPGQLFYSTQIPVCLWFLARNKSGKTPSPISGEGGRRPGGGFRDRRGETLFIDARKMGTLVDRVHRELTDEDVARIAGTYHAWRSNPPQSPFAKGGSAEVPPSEKVGSAEAPPFAKVESAEAPPFAKVESAEVPPFAKGESAEVPPFEKVESVEVPPFEKVESVEVPPFEKVESAEVPPFEKGGLGGIYQDIPGFCKSAKLEDIRKHGHVLTPGRYVGAEEIEDDGEPFEEKMQRLVAQLNEQFAESAKLEQAIKVNMARLGYGL